MRIAPPPFSLAFDPDFPSTATCALARRHGAAEEGKDCGLANGNLWLIAFSAQLWLRAQAGIAAQRIEEGIHCAAGEDILNTINKQAVGFRHTCTLNGHTVDSLCAH